MAGETFKKSTAREYFESLAITVILALFGTTFIVQAFKIPTPSMEDNLLVGDHLLVNKFAFGARDPSQTPFSLCETFIGETSSSSSTLVIFRSTM